MENLEFSDRRAILVTHDDARLAQVSGVPLRHEQPCDGPIYLVIRHNATDESLLGAATKFGVPMRDMAECRAHQAR